MPLTRERKAASINLFSTQFNSMISQSLCSISWNCMLCARLHSYSTLLCFLRRIYTCLEVINGILNEISSPGSTVTQGMGKVLHHPISDNTPGILTLVLDINSNHRLPQYVINDCTICCQSWPWIWIPWINSWSPEIVPNRIFLQGNPKVSWLPFDHFHHIFFCRGVPNSPTPIIDELTYSSICRVFTLVRVDQLKQILVEGFNAISDTVVFSTNPMIISSLYLADGGSHFQQISLEDLSTEFLSTKQEINSWNQPILSEEEMPLLKQCKLIKPLVLLRLVLCLFFLSQLFRPPAVNWISNTLEWWNISNPQLQQGIESGFH